MNELDNIGIYNNALKDIHSHPISKFTPHKYIFQAQLLLRQCHFKTTLKPP
jgi:hypothetical protein